MNFLVYLIAVIACTVGAICGIGGGVIIKPVMDLLCDLSSSTISFLSSCTVFTMSAYTALKSAVNKKLKFKEYLSITVGASIGGIIGKELFEIVKLASSNKNLVSVIQSAVLALLCGFVLIYTVKKDKIKTLKIENHFLRILIGLLLGCFSSFLGIGGGPINIVVLHYFLSMDSKEAASCSLFIILFSQFASLASTILKQNIPEFKIEWLIILTLCGIIGGIFGRKISNKVDNKKVDKLFIIVVLVILAICIFNSCKYRLN